MRSTDTPAAWNAEGVRRRAAGDWRGALRAFHAAAAADPALPEPLANAAAVFLAAGDPERAHRTAAVALTLDSAHPVALPVSRLAAALLGRRAPTADVVRAFAAGELALVLLAAGRDGHAHAAAAVLRRALEVRGELPALLFAAAILCATGGDRASAAWFASRLPAGFPSLAPLLSERPDDDTLRRLTAGVGAALAAEDARHGYARAYWRIRNDSAPGV
ncbi:MAG TPA: hypothetical protein VFE05_02655 [Longimicrobiaceae bacterium]|jgi:hypothetical protein|nr:hypothetical protein [Longimicrobiaceae bacterium]